MKQTQSFLALRILYPVWAAVGMFGILYVPSRIMAEGDAVATAANIIELESLFRAGIASNLVTQLLFVAVALLLYVGFKKINATHATLMAVLALVSVPIAMTSELANIAAILSADGNPEQAQLFLQLNAAGITIASIFWGLWLFPLGKLVSNSGWFPKFLGTLLYIAGAAYAIGSFIGILLPEQEALRSIIEIGTLGEIVFLLWLIIRGPRTEKKTEQA